VQATKTNQKKQDMKNQNQTTAPELFLFRNISIPVETWGEHRGNVIVGDVVGYKLGEGADECAGAFYIQNAKRGGTELIITEDDYRGAKLATKYDLMRAGL
jgi:hypothetical protein